MNRTYQHAPFQRAGSDTAGIMAAVIIALLPCASFGVYKYGRHAAILLGICVAVCVLSELLMDLIMRRLTVLDYSAVVTGLTLGLLLPPKCPYLYAVIGSIIAIIPVKCLFGGIGRNILNPAGTAKCMLLILFHHDMMQFAGGAYSDLPPLLVLKETGEFTGRLTDVLLGRVSGNIGTSSALLILIGAVILMLLGITDAVIPISALAGFIVFWIFFGHHGLSPYYLELEVLSGSFLFVIFFMAQDYTTRPITRKGRILYGILIGLFTGIIRFLNHPENAALYALLAANLCTKIIDARIITKPFGTQVVARRQNMENIPYHHQE